MLQIGLPSPSLFGLGPEVQCRRLAKAGFGAIEVFLFPSQAENVPLWRKCARRYGLSLSLHQPWSRSEGGGYLINRILDTAGYLPREGYTLQGLTSGARGEMCVTYCDRFDEVLKITHSGAAHAFQTTTAWSGVGSERKLRMSYCEFLECIVPSRFPIVFDTYHVLEWILDSPGKKLLRWSEKELASTLLAAWNDIDPERIIEIHWNDFAPIREDDLRDCLPGDGLLANGLKMLAKEMERSRWTGTIISEVSPFSLFPYSRKKLVALRERIESFF